MAATKRPPKSKHRCGRCNRRLRQDHWVYSTHTGKRYCWPGEGCHKDAILKKDE